MPGNDRRLNVPYATIRLETRVHNGVSAGPVGGWGCRMGAMRFLVNSPQLLENCPKLERAYISGSDGRIFPTRIEISDRVITCRRTGCESGRFQLAWPVPGFGVPVVTTASLPEREEPYLLTLELARGKIAQVRDQVSLWEVSGMFLPDSCTRPLSEAHRAFR